MVWVAIRLRSQEAGKLLVDVFGMQAADRIGGMLLAPAGVPALEVLNDHDLRKAPILDEGASSTVCREGSEGRSRTRTCVIFRPIWWSSPRHRLAG
jgi:hypothetical protein